MYASSPNPDNFNQNDFLEGVRNIFTALGFVSFIVGLIHLAPSMKVNNETDWLSTSVAWLIAVISWVIVFLTDNCFNSNKD